MCRFYVIPPEATEANHPGLEAIEANHPDRRWTKLPGTSVFVVHLNARAFWQIEMPIVVLFMCCRLSHASGMKRSVPWLCIHDVPPLDCTMPLIGPFSYSNNMTATHPFLV